MSLTARAFRLWKRAGITTLIKTGIRKIGALLHSWTQRALTPPASFSFGYGDEDNTHVTLYANDPMLFPRYPFRQSLARNSDHPASKVSLIAVVLNEISSVPRWSQAILEQTRLPDELVIVDSGSTDGTLESLNAWASRCRVPCRVIVEPGASIARARNIAIARAQYSIIAVTDLGCVPRPDWLDKLSAPFEIQPDTLAAGGTYEPVNHLGHPMRESRWMWLSPKSIDPQTYLPPGASLALKKHVWEAVGGYPEWLTPTGEDTCFDLELKRYGGEWAFVPEAVIGWIAPETWWSGVTKRFKWAAGDGEAGARASYYWKSLWRIAAALILILATLLIGAVIIADPIRPVWLWSAAAGLAWIIGLAIVARAKALPILLLPQVAIVQAAQAAGFVLGARRQTQITSRRLSAVKGVLFILSGVPIDDTGGGSRGAQIAFELLRRGFAVVFINQFPRFERQEITSKISHPHLFTYALSDTGWQRFLSPRLFDLIHQRPMCLVEFPTTDFLPIIRGLRARGATIVYDLMDAWDTSLGAPWYSRETEKTIARNSHALVATVPALAQRLERITGRPVAVLPNAVNSDLFDPHRQHARPLDLPSAEWTAIYIGALWGEWFDWELLAQLARRHPEAAFVVIGDYRGQCAAALPNLHFLGLKAQRELPAYLAHANVAIIPWKIGAITQTTSPLKVYEYLAMRRPVVAPALEPLREMPAVFLANDADEFMAKLTEARRTPFPETEVASFIDENNWRARVGFLLAQVERVSRNEPLIARS